MSHEDHPPTVEQSWIVLDEHGWSSASRPPTASPSRLDPRLHDDEEEDHMRRRLGMDRDVREALELAEQSLELAGSVDEFNTRPRRTSSDEDLLHAKSSPLVNFVAKSGWTDESPPDDRYNGRAPPVIKRSLAIATDSEHVAFKNIKMVSSPRDDHRHAQSMSTSQTDGFREVSSSSDSRAIENAYPTKENTSCAEYEENGESLLHWFFGLQSNASIVPVIVSHSLTLLAGLYLGYRRASCVQPAPTTTSTNVSAVSHQ